MKEVGILPLVICGAVVLFGMGALLARAAWLVCIPAVLALFMLRDCRA